MNASKTVCIDQIPKVIAAAKESQFIREQLRPLLDAGWAGCETHAHNTIRERSPHVWVAAKPNQDGSFDIYSGPGAVYCKVKSVAEVLEFADKLKKAVEVSDLN